MEIITANELLSGAVVYLDTNDKWVSDINAARLFGANETELRDAKIAGARANNRLVGIETEKVEQVDGKVIASRLRERIRAEGPTAPYGPERQELEEGDHVSL